jgi:integrase
VAQVCLPQRVSERAIVFSNAGEPLHGAEVLKAWKAACRRAGVAERRFHDIRHTSAHLLTDAGVAKDTRKARLGHSTDRMAEHYGGASEAQDRIAADAIGRALGGTS